jgi:uncharacterized SAM-binding protein YcdF (DUF218 family)
VPYDAILIPGGGVRQGGVLPDYVAVRFERALVLAGNAFLVPLSAGTPHRPPPLDTRGFPITEARAGADYLLARGIDRSRLLLEELSFDTIGNALFSRVIHAIPRQFRRILVVTSVFHMPRTEAVFRWVYGLDAPGLSCAVDFETVPDVGIDPEVLAGRRAKEQHSLDALQPLIARIRSLPELHLWLFTEHDAYAAGPRTPAIQVDTRTY